jgi:signal transduction histidine kinase
MGTLTVGSRLDNALAEQFKRATESDIVFVVGGRVRASTLPAGDQERLGSLAEGDQVRTIALANGEYVALTRPLFPAAISMSAAGAPKVLLLRSRTERLRFLDAIHTGLGVVAMIAVLAATIVSYAVARTITRPLATITGVMREMSATGDLTRKISVSRDATWDDEDATLLATTFNTLTDSIARFQREAAQRERLSALGRLSTVIAHEIRNPLMIIKGSLRALSNERVSREDIKQVLADVDEEVARLNRVVNDVLDFARPIHFNYTQTDLNALCANAVGATRTEHAEMTVSIEPDPTLASIETDAERLRTALVNLLANARHAVAARTGARGDGPDIELGTADLGATVRITIRDRGVGVNPDDLPRIFDPYFTTKRTGSGLGLAIARNIIEGMKGSISFKSEVGVGTEISIQLPKRPEDPEESSPSLRMATTEPGTTLTPVDSEPRQTRQRGASA